MTFIGWIVVSIVLLNNCESELLETITVHLRLENPVNDKQNLLWLSSADHPYCDDLLKALTDFNLALNRTILLCADKPHTWDGDIPVTTVQLNLWQGSYRGDDTLQTWRTYWSDELVPSFNRWFAEQKTVVVKSFAGIQLLHINQSAVQTFQLCLSIEDLDSEDADLKTLGSTFKNMISGFAKDKGIQSALLEVTVLNGHKSYFFSNYNLDAKITLDYATVYRKQLYLSQSIMAPFFGHSVYNYSKTKLAHWNHEIKASNAVEGTQDTRQIFYDASAVRKDCHNHVEVVSLIIQQRLVLSKHGPSSKDTDSTLFTGEAQSLIEATIAEAEKDPRIRFITCKPQVITDTVYKADVGIYMNQEVLIAKNLRNVEDKIKDIINWYKASKRPWKVTGVNLMDIFLQSHLTCASQTSASKSIQSSLIGVILWFITAILVVHYEIL